MTDQPLLAAQQVSLRYGAQRALDHAEVALWPGEVLAVVGESGSGKSSLLNVLSGQIAPQSGHVWYNDPSGTRHDVHAMPAPVLRCRLGWPPVSAFASAAPPRPGAASSSPLVASSPSASLS